MGELLCEVADDAVGASMAAAKARAAQAAMTLTTLRTLGGHRRYRESGVRNLRGGTGITS